MKFTKHKGFLPFTINFLFLVQCANKAPPSVNIENLPQTTKELRVKQTRMSNFDKRDLTLIEYKIKKIVVTAHLASAYPLKFLPLRVPQHS